MEGVRSQCPPVQTGHLQRSAHPLACSIRGVVTRITAQSFLSPPSQDMIELKPAVYILKHVLHDWSDSYCHQILKHLRDAAAHSSEKPTLLVIDFIVSLACHINEDEPDNDDSNRCSLTSTGKSALSPTHAHCLGARIGR